MEFHVNVDAICFVADKGIQSFDVDLKEKTVAVKGTMDSNAILEIIQKTGKTVSYLGERK